MGDEEIYVTCLCGALVDVKNLNHHAEDCLKESLRNAAVTLKVSHSPGSDLKEAPKPKERHGFAKCMRCGYTMTKNEGSLITFYPTMHKSSVTSCSYSKRMPQKEPECKMCKLPSEFHQDASDDENETFACVADAESDKPNDAKGSSGKRMKCRERKSVASQFLESDSETTDAGNSETVPEHEHSVISDGIPSGPPCKQFHLALLTDYDNAECNGDTMYQNYALLLQILDTLPPRASGGTQTDLPTTENVGVQVKILGVYPEEVEKLIAADKGYSLPEFDPAAESAYQSHLSTLIPCPHCSRTFSPDRIQKHISCCIDRPRTREYKTPEGGEIKR